ncbi:MAG: thioredoxin [Candidatus Endolissoclinum sp. TMED37]|nr:MAG: thioredoxin [Candidatus Endolissoclinum sp. TMED37]|tara:strand:+ start:1103 stop:1405 length:303 start_codon:yes stop_codon:yes gene_type:complete
MKNINTSEFDTAVKSNVNVIVQFSAEWCGPCKRLSPILDNFAESRPDVTVFKVDIGTQADLAVKYSVKSIPKLVFFKNGNKTNEKIGLVNEVKLAELLGE